MSIIKSELFLFSGKHVGLVLTDRKYKKDENHNAVGFFLSCNGQWSIQLFPHEVCIIISLIDKTSHSLHWHLINDSFFWLARWVFCRCHMERCNRLEESFAAKTLYISRPNDGAVFFKWISTQRVNYVVIFKDNYKYFDSSSLTVNLKLC
jgi:hypothetical protein